MLRTSRSAGRPSGARAEVDVGPVDVAAELAQGDRARPARPVPAGARRRELRESAAAGAIVAVEQGQASLQDRGRRPRPVEPAIRRGGPRGSNRRACIAASSAEHATQRGIGAVAWSTRACSSSASAPAPSPNARAARAWARAITPARSRGGSPRPPARRRRGAGPPRRRGRLARRAPRPRARPAKIRPGSGRPRSSRRRRRRRVRRPARRPVEVAGARTRRRRARARWRTSSASGLPTGCAEGVVADRGRAGQAGRPGCRRGRRRVELRHEPTARRTSVDGLHRRLFVGDRPERLAPRCWWCSPHAPSMSASSSPSASAWACWIRSSQIGTSSGAADGDQADEQLEDLPRVGSHGLGTVVVQPRADRLRRHLGALGQLIDRAIAASRTRRPRSGRRAPWRAARAPGDVAARLEGAARPVVGGAQPRPRRARPAAPAGTRRTGGGSGTSSPGRRGAPGTGWRRRADRGPTRRRRAR